MPSHIPQTPNPPLNPSERQALYDPREAQAVLDMLRRVLMQARGEQLGGQFGGGAGGLYGAVPDIPDHLPQLPPTPSVDRAALLESLVAPLRRQDAQLGGEFGGGYGGLSDALLPSALLPPGRQASTAFLSGVARPTLMDLLRALFAKAGGPVPPLNGREAVQPRRFTNVPPLER